MTPKTALPLVAVVAAAALLASGIALAAKVAVPGNPSLGKAYFVRPGLFCGSCHILKAVRSTGRDGANLDNAKPSYARIVEFITKGSPQTKQWPAGMPTYGGRVPEITKAQIQDIAAFVYNATHK